MELHSVLYNGHIWARNVGFTKYVKSHYTADKFCIVTATIIVWSYDVYPVV